MREIIPQIGNLTNLTMLFLDDNSFRVIPSINMLQKLHELDMGCNNLEGNASMEITQRKNLGIIDLFVNIS